MNFRKHELLSGLALLFSDSGTNTGSQHLSTNLLHFSTKSEPCRKADAQDHLSVVLRASDPWFTPALLCHLSHKGELWVSNICQYLSSVSKKITFVSHMHHHQDQNCCPVKGTPIRPVFIRL